MSVFVDRLVQVGEIADLPEKGVLAKLFGQFASVGCTFSLKGTEIKGFVAVTALLVEIIVHAAQHCVDIAATRKKLESQLDAAATKLSKGEIDDAVLKQFYTEASAAMTACRTASATFKQVQTKLVETMKSMPTDFGQAVAIAKNADMVVKVLSDNLQESAIWMLESAVSPAQACLSTLLDVAEHSDIKTFHEDVASSEYTEECVTSLLNAAQGEHGSKHYAFFKPLKKYHKIPAAIEKDFIVVLQDLGVNVEDAKLVAFPTFATTLDDRCDAIFSLMAELSSVISLFRDLGPGETREGLLARVVKGIDGDSRMKLPERLSSAIEAAREQKAEPAPQSNGDVAA